LPEEEDKKFFKKRVNLAYRLNVGKDQGIKIKKQFLLDKKKKKNTGKHAR
jgi:hypothetical protein